MARSVCFSLSLLFLAACAAEKKTGLDPMVLLEARLSSLEAQLQDSRVTQERMAGSLEALTARAKPIAPASRRTPRSRMRKTSHLPIKKLTPGENAAGDDTESDEAEGEAEMVVDSRHEGLHLYRQGLQFLKDRKFDEALDRFRQFLKDNPDHVYADRAHYLITEAHYGNKEYGLVIVAAKLLETKYPFSFRVPQACYYRAMALLSMGQRPQATDAFREILKRFPTDQAAEQASRKLAELSLTRRNHENVPLLPEAGT